MARIADILTKARKQHFTGRENELAEFQKLLTEKNLPYNILFIHGPAGQGKTSLLRELTERCLHTQNPYMYIDGRDVIPSTAGFYEALCDGLNVTSTQEAIGVFEKSDKTFVLFIDNYNKLAPLENWLREEFLPMLPEHLLTVLLFKEPILPLPLKLYQTAAWLLNICTTVLLQPTKPSFLSPASCSSILTCLP